MGMIVKPLKMSPRSFAARFLESAALMPLFFLPRLKMLRDIKSTRCV